MHLLIALIVYIQISHDNTYHELHDIIKQVFRELPFRVCWPIPFVILQFIVLDTHILFSRCCSLVHVGTKTIQVLPWGAYHTLQETKLQTPHHDQENDVDDLDPVSIPTPLVMVHDLVVTNKHWFQTIE